MKKKILVIWIILILTIVGLSGCNGTTNTLNPIKNKFIGDWDGGAIQINIYSDGTVKMHDKKTTAKREGTWEVNGDILIFHFGYDWTWYYEFSNNFNTLTLTRTATGQTIEFTKQ